MVKAVIFDMNGVIITDEDIQVDAWKELFKKLNFHLTNEDFKQKVSGRTEREVLETLLQKKLSEEELDNYSNQRIDLAIEKYKPHLSLTSGLREFLNDLKENNIPMGVATSNRRRYMNFIVDGLQIRDYFSVILTAQDIVKGKPDPEIYLKTAKSMKVSPENCAVFEDSLSGVAAGKAAGMKVVGVATTLSVEELTMADKVIPSFDHLTFSDIVNL